MDPNEVRCLVMATGEEITDDEGRVIGYVSQPARFKIDRSYLARGGFLVVTRDDDTGEYIGTEFDALEKSKTREPYPAGHSEQAWRTASLDEACRLVLAYFKQPQTDTP